MPEVQMEIKNAVGLHARPAALFVQTASRFLSSITVRNGALSANAKSILHILSLGAEEGSVITVTAEGEDADQALTALIELNASNYGEEE